MGIPSKHLALFTAKCVPLGHCNAVNVATKLYGIGEMWYLPRQALTKAMRAVGMRAPFFTPQRPPPPCLATCSRCDWSNAMSST